MDEKYPQGFPSLEEIQNQKENLTCAAQASGHLDKVVLSEEDKRIVNEDKDVFADINQASDDIEECGTWCSALTGIQAGISSKLLPEEKERLERLSAKFKEGAPSEEELQGALTAADEMDAAKRQLSDTMMSEEHQIRFRKLSEFFKGELPEESELSACEESQNKRVILLNQKNTCALSEKEEQEYSSLKRVFACGVPEEEEINTQQKNCRRIIQLKSKKETKTTRVEKDAAPARSGTLTAVICGIIGAVLLIAGIVCFLLVKNVPGIIFLVIGLAGLFLAFWFGIRKMIGSSKGGRTVTVSAISDKENQELYDLQRTVNDFLMRFYADASDPENKLTQLSLDRKTFMDLKEKEVQIKEECGRIDGEIKELDRFLSEVFSRYYPGEPLQPDFAGSLKENCREYNTLKAEADSVARDREKYFDQIEGCRSQILKLLNLYYDEDDLPEDLRAGVRQLEADVKSFSELSHKKDKILNDNADSQARADELSRKIQEMLTRYRAYDLEKTPEECLQQLRGRLEAYKLSAQNAANYEKDKETYSTEMQKAQGAVENFLKNYALSGDTPANLLNQADNDIRSRNTLETSLEKAREKLKAFLKENPGITEQSAKEEAFPEPEVLQEAEKAKQEEIVSLDETLRKLRQSQDKLRADAESIPALNDEIVRINLELDSEERKCVLADKTMELLGQAKDNLSNSYVGKVERGFDKYAYGLLGDELGQVYLDTDLNLTMDEKGAARDITLFSPGIEDWIMLCMRLSLVDALFTKEKPFLILDDPFVNLDDDHTQSALKVLGRVAQEYQVVYLVCSSSRCAAPEEGSAEV